ncbi:transporter substrate-binding domain-containing protein, partial [Mycolicibacterium sphagni]
LRGQRVAVKNGTEGAEFAESIKDEYGFSTVYFADSASMYDEVRTGNSVAIFDEVYFADSAIAQGNGFKTVTPKEQGANYGFAVNKGQNAELLTMFNAGLQNLRDSGRYDEIIDSYLGEGAAVSDNSFLGLLKSTFPLLMAGLKMTMILTVVSIAVALLLGVIFGLMRVSRSLWLRAIAVALLLGVIFGLMRVSRSLWLRAIGTTY